ncbi:hypothetical protein WDU94_002253 [Cyamophila willieti]
MKISVESKYGMKTCDNELYVPPLSPHTVPDETSTPPGKRWYNSLNNRQSKKGKNRRRNQTLDPNSQWYDTSTNTPNFSLKKKHNSVITLSQEVRLTPTPSHEERKPQQCQLAEQCLPDSKSMNFDDIQPTPVPRKNQENKTGIGK